VCILSKLNLKKEIKGDDETWPTVLFHLQKQTQGYGSLNIIGLKLKKEKSNVWNKIEKEYLENLRKFII